MRWWHPRVRRGGWVSQVSVPRSGDDTGVVGFNPYEKYRARAFDYVLVAVCTVVAIGAVVWAFVG